MSDDADLPCILKRLTHPSREPHIAAVKAALRDGRIGQAAFAEHAGLSLRVLQAWLDAEHLQVSFANALDTLATCTSIPGFDGPPELLMPKVPALRGDASELRVGRRSMEDSQ